MTDNRSWSLAKTVRCAQPCTECSLEEVGVAVFVAENTRDGPEKEKSHPIMRNGKDGDTIP